MTQAVLSIDVPISTDGYGAKRALTFTIGNRSGFNIERHIGPWGTPEWAQQSLAVKDAVRQLIGNMFRAGSLFKP